MTAARSPHERSDMRGFPGCRFAHPGYDPVGWAKRSVPTIFLGGLEGGGHGASAPLPTLRVVPQLAAAPSFGGSACAPRTSLPGRGPLARPSRWVTTTETMVES